MPSSWIIGDIWLTAPEVATLISTLLAASSRLDYELEMGIFIGPGNPLGEPVPIETPPPAPWERLLSALHALRMPEPVAAQAFATDEVQLAIVQLQAGAGRERDVVVIAEQS